MDISALLAASQEDEDRNPLLREPPGGVPKQGNSSRQQENSRPAGQVSAPGLALAAIQDEDSDEDWFNEYSCELALFGDSATQNSLPDSKKQQQTKQGAQTSEAMSIPEKDTTRDSLELQADTAQAARSNSHFEQDMEEDIEPQDQAKNHSTVTDRHFQPGINTDATSGDDVLPQQQLEHESHEEADIARQRACLAVNEDDEGDGIDNHVAWNEAMETRDEGLEQASHDKTESHPIHSEDIPATSHAPTAADITPQHQAAAQPAEGCTNCHPDAARDMSLGGGEEPACGGISRPGDNSMEISPESAGNNLLEAQNIVEKQAEEPILQDNGPGAGRSTKMTTPQHDVRCSNRRTRTLSEARETMHSSRMLVRGHLIEQGLCGSIGEDAQTRNLQTIQGHESLKKLKACGIAIEDGNPDAADADRPPRKYDSQTTASKRMKFGSLDERNERISAGLPSKIDSFLARNGHNNNFSGLEDRLRRNSWHIEKLLQVCREQHDRCLEARVRLAVNSNLQARLFSPIVFQKLMSIQKRAKDAGLMDHHPCDTVDANEE